MTMKLLQLAWLPSRIGPRSMLDAKARAPRSGVSNAQLRLTGADGPFGHTKGRHVQAAPLFIQAGAS